MATSSGTSASSSSANGARRARSASMSSDHRAAPTGSVYQGSRPIAPAKSTRWRPATNRPTSTGSRFGSGSWRSTQAWSLTRTPPQSAISSPARVRRSAGVGTPAASAASWNAAPSSSSASSAAGTSPTCLIAQLPLSVSSRQIEPSRPLATGPSESRPHDPRSNAARIDATCTGGLGPDRGGQRVPDQPGGAEAPRHPGQHDRAAQAVADERQRRDHGHDEGHRRERVLRVPLPGVGVVGPGMAGLIGPVTSRSTPARSAPSPR